MKNKSRKSYRLPGGDYSSDGHYFATICTKKYYFGKIIDGEMKLNALGEIAHQEWLRTEQIRSTILLDEFIVMPNHLHGIIIIKNLVGMPHRGIPTKHPHPARTHRRGDSVSLSRSDIKKDFYNQGIIFHYTSDWKK